ncbi:UNVERIFIED_CONTAM: TetR family transcriptional regulator, partial [Salmonella enterica subsp. enterica serovar Weltevreden]
MSRPTPVVAQGKKLLMKAALRMSARVGSIGSLGLRELAREAGVDPTTFYRHFKSFDELGLAVMQGLADQLRPPLR